MERSIPECKKMSVTFATVTKKHTIEGVVLPKLCHGERIVNVQFLDDDVEACDAVVTSNKELSLGIRTADCAPICFSDGKKIGIAHIGWRGLCLGLIEKMLKEFDRGTVEVFVGPRLDVFEIQKDLCYDVIKEKFGEEFFGDAGGKTIFCFKDAIASLLPARAIFDARNTDTDMLLPSHRRNKTSERLLTVVGFNT